MSDLVERLRKWALFSIGIGAMDSETVMLEAADEIERLTLLLSQEGTFFDELCGAKQRIAELEAAVETYADGQYWNPDNTHAKGLGPGIARRALQEKPDE